MNPHIKSDDKVKEKNFKVLSNLTSQDIPKVSAPPTKAPSKQNKISDSEPKQEPSKKEGNSPTINCAIVGNIDILNQPFTVGIQKKGEDICFGGSATFNDFNFTNFISKYEFIPKDIIPDCIDKKDFSGIAVIVTLNIGILKKGATEQDKTTEIELELTIGDNEKITFTIEKPFEENKDDHSKKTDVQNDEEPSKQQDENKSFYWTIEYASKKQDQPNDANDDNGIKVGKLIRDFANGVAHLMGFDDISLPGFIENFTITEFTATNKPQNNSKLSNANQDESKKFINITIKTTLGSVEVKLPEEKNKEQSKNEKEDDSTQSNETWSITYKPKDESNGTDDSIGLNIHKLPVAGEILNLVSPPSDESKYEVKLTEVAYSKKDGLSISFNAFGNDHTINLPKLAKQKKEDPEPKPQENMLMAINDSTDDESESGLGFTGNAVWKKIDKTFSVLSIPKIGIGLDHKRIVFLLDASLSVSPLTFSLKEAGLGIVPNLKNFDLRFYISGFGVGFDNGVLSIGGGFYQSKKDKNNHPVYTGDLLIRFKEIGLTAIGSYTEGSMWAYLALLAPIGGPPAFFVKGLAAGFGYNNRLILPSIEEVNSYPLILAATKGFDKTKDSKNNLLDDLKNKIIPEKGQYFLAAGIKFTSFQIINGFILATASFGNDCELGLLGLAEITVPPNVGNNGNAKCLAKAQLAIKASVKPNEGVFSAAAQLTNESYILSKKCKLSGGFAVCVWFGNNEHSGDFVISLGGYASTFNKPDHYPTVQRLGLNWQVDDNISIGGEVYFALTPKNIMAGGKLNAIYSKGPLKAWFTAYADIIMNWKPFKYDITVGAFIGASYTFGLRFIRKTISIEVGTDLRLQGPELHGTINFKLYIFSFTIDFGDDFNPEETVSWNNFLETFFVDNQKNSSTNNENNNDSNADSRSSDILSISFDGVVKNKDGKSNGIDIVSPYEFSISAISKIPRNTDNNTIHVRPVGQDAITDSLSVIVEKIDTKDSHDITNQFNKPNDIKQNLPAALWGSANDDKSVISTLRVGQKLTLKQPSALNPENQFPKNRWILLTDLYQKNFLPKDGTYLFKFEQSRNLKLSVLTIDNFIKNEKESINKKINNFLKTRNKGPVNISKLVNNAESWFSEDFMIFVEEG